jgi:hypothetical protein
MWYQANSTGMPPDQKVNKAEELTYISIDMMLCLCQKQPAVVNPSEYGGFTTLPM